MFSESACINNTSQGNGGCFHTNGYLQCTDSIISGNKAALGGGIYADFGALPNIDNSTITDNTALQSGGAWFGFGADQQAFQTDDFAIITNNNAACCYASGYGSALQSNSTSTGRTCADLDSGM
jgi:hypothetical protein